MNFIILFFPVLLAFILSAMIIPYVVLITYKKRLFDPIDGRKLHRSIVPRLGGVAFVPIQCCVLCMSIVAMYKVPMIYAFIEGWQIQTWIVFPMFIMLMCGLVVLYLVGLADDLIGVKHKSKFVVQLIVSSFFPISGLWINNLYGVGFVIEITPWLGIPLTMFITILIINSINLIDGLDGLCSGLVALACLVFGILFSYYGAWIHSLLAFITLAVLLPFFYYNVFGISKRRRRIFMGDTGSTTLGYTIAFLAISFSMHEVGIKGFSEGAIVVAASVLIVPVFDVARVVAIRFMTRQPLFKPDRNHLHHKLIRSGFSHRNAMISIFIFSAFYALFNLILVQYISNNILLLLNFVVWVFVTIFFNRMVDNRLSRKTRL